MGFEYVEDPTKWPAEPGSACSVGTFFQNHWELRYLGSHHPGTSELLMTPQHVDLAVYGNQYGNSWNIRKTCHTLEPLSLSATQGILMYFDPMPWVLLSRQGSWKAQGSSSSSSSPSPSPSPSSVVEYHMLPMNQTPDHGMQGMQVFRLYTF